MIALLSLFMWCRLCAAVHGYLQRYAPTNIAIRYLRSGRGLNWAIPAALVLALAYLVGAHACTTAIDGGGPGWLHLVTLVLIWDAMKFGILSALTPVLYLERALKSKAAQSDRRQAPPQAL